MKNLLLRCLSVILSVAPLAAMAQPVLKNIEDFPIGYKMTYGVLGDHINPGVNGSNVTWDYAHLDRGVKDTVRQEIVPVGKTAYASEYPKSGYAEQNSDGSLVFVEKNDRLSMVWGVVNKYAKIKYETPYNFVMRPFHYGDSLVSSPTRSMAAYGNTMNGKGTTKTYCDSWGSLILPTGTYNALRIRFEQTFSDVGSDGSVTTTTIKTYAWFDENHLGALLRIDLVTIKSPAYNNTIETAQYLLADGK